MRPDIEYRISELMDNYDDERVTLPDCGITTPERIEQLVMQKLGTAPRKRAAPRRIGRALLIAAAVTVLLAAAAFAAYRFTLEDMLVPESETTGELQGEAAVMAERFPAETVTVSFNGLIESPEAAAQQAWADWLAAYNAENPDPWGARGVDDDWYETPDNYCWFYDAPFREQAAALDAIAAEYGLTLHTLRLPYITESDLCTLLGTVSIWPQSDWSAGYVYEDGTFRLDTEFSGGVTASTWLNVDGSFTMVSRRLSAEYEQWSHTTPEGLEIVLALADNYAVQSGNAKTGVICARLDEAMVTVFLSGIENREQVEQYADALALDELARVFSAATDRSALADAVAAAYALYQTEQTERAAQAEAKDAARQAEWDAYLARHSEAEWEAIVYKTLGEYEPPYILAGREAARHYVDYYWDTLFKVVYSYTDSSGAASYTFSYERLWTDDTQTESCTGQHYEKQLAARPEAEIHTVAGQEICLLQQTGLGPELYWYDRERDLLFSICDQTIFGSDRANTAEELFALAEAFLRGQTGE